MARTGWLCQPELAPLLYFHVAPPGAGGVGWQHSDLAPPVSGDRYLGPIRVSDLRGPFRVAKIARTTCQESWPARVSGAGLASHSPPDDPLESSRSRGARTGPIQLTKRAKGP